MIHVEHLSKHFGSVIALDDVSITVKPGELYALLGPNGAGKSTTISCLLGFESPTTGKLSINGVDVIGDTEKARLQIAYIPEQVSLYENFSGIENVSYFGGLVGRSLTDVDSRLLLSEVGLDASAQDRRTSTYSKGMRQKVGIAIALAKSANVLLLDEPTSGLDPASSHEFSLALRKLKRKGITILMATHDLFRTMQDADKIGILVNGRLVAERMTSEMTMADLETLYVDAVTSSFAEANRASITR